MCDTGYYGYENVKVMAHALVGYVSGELAGSKSSFSNALAAGANKFVTEEILKDEKTKLHYAKHPEELQWISAALGAAIGQMAGGDATSGASIAASGTKNNRLNEEEFEQYKRDLADAESKAEIMAILEKYQKLDEQNEQKLQEALKNPDFYGGLAKALKENPDLKEYQGIIISGKSIQNAYSGEKELAVRYGGVDENGNYILKDNKVAIDNANEEMKKDALIIALHHSTGGVSKGLQGIVDIANYFSIASEWYDGYFSNDDEVLKRASIDSGATTTNYIGKKVFGNKYSQYEEIASIIGAIFKQNLTQFNDKIKRTENNVKGGNTK